MHTSRDFTESFFWHTAPVPELAGKSEWSVQVDPKIRAPKDGPYAFYMRAGDGSRLFVDGQCVIDFWRPGNTTGLSKPKPT